MNKYSAAIIGCGSIGAMKDNKFDHPGRENVLTHTHALYDNPQIREIIFIDSDLPKAGKAAEKWYSKDHNGVWAAESIREFVENQVNKPDIVVISVPTTMHYTILTEVLSFDYWKPKAIVMEKPCGITLHEAHRMQQLVSDIPVFVNYSRRYNHHYQVLANELQDKRIFHCRVAYTRGFRREACHAIDLCNWWFGKYKDGIILFHKASHLLTDFSKEDPTYAAWLSYERCPHVFFCPSDGRDYSVFEIDIFTEDGRFVLVDHGKSIVHCPIIKEPTYGNYSALSKYYDSEVKTDIENICLPNLHANVIATIEGKSDPICGIEDAIRVHEVYEKVGTDCEDSETIHSVPLYSHPPNYDFSKCLCPENKTGCPIHGMHA